MLSAQIFKLDALADVLAAEHEAADRARADGKNLGPLVPFARMADELGGSWPIGLSCLHAGPGAGKSAMCIQCVLSADCSATYVTCEMSGPSVGRRIIANETGRYLGRLRPGEMSSVGIRGAADAVAQRHPDVYIIDASTAPCSEAMLRGQMETMRCRDSHGLLVVDSLHAWAASIEPQREEYQAVSIAIETLRRLSIDYHIAVVAIVERNRASMLSGGISAGAASRKIEYSAEAVIELECIDAARGAVNLRFVKNRNGRAGVTIGFRFSGATQRFEEIGDPWDNSGHITSRRRNHHLDEEPKDAA